MTPAYEDASTIPYLLPAHCTKLKMSNTRKKQLVKAANRNFNNPPSKPKNDECCGSNCTPCVKDLWKEDVLVWRQRWGMQEDGRQTLEKALAANSIKVDRSCSHKIPGSFDW